MKKLVISLFVLFLTIGITRADEGMWIPSLLEQLNESEMIDMGMRITAKDIYDINNSSIKDAIVHIGGCTASIVSNEGLMLTNHHCGYGKIQAHSTVENDYLTDGFWAMSKEEELPNPGMIARFLISIEEVTNKILDGVTPEMTEKDRAEKIRENTKNLKEESVKDTHYDAFIRSFYYGNQYYLFITETYKDVRLVGAPPSNIGKFGGDTDNWAWPRHTGDFSVFRVYADKDNKPAEYSEDNVPLKPKYFLPVSLKGVNEGDFTFVFGYPGRTSEYIHSMGVQMITEERNPVMIEARTRRLDIFNKEIVKDALTRLQYSSKGFGISNGWKKAIGESKGIQQTKAIAKKQKFEKEFDQWANATSSRKAEYGNLISDFEKTYTELMPLYKSSTINREAGYGIEMISFARRFERLINAAKTKDFSDEKYDAMLASAINSVERHFKNYVERIDRQVCTSLLDLYQTAEAPAMLPAFYQTINGKYKGDLDKYTNYLFSKSAFVTKEKILKALGSKGKVKKLAKDPAFQMVLDLNQLTRQYISDRMSVLNNNIDSMMRIYMKGQMEMQTDRRFYPDANSTIRVHYGNVRGFKPKDAVNYKHFTTLEGIIAKENPDIYDYVVEDRLKELYNNKDYGKYADADGSIHVCFLAANHTSGGNSGSPVLDADGDLIGLNFDRCWEGTMSDLNYDVDLCRNITVDIRYVLFVMDKFAGAGHLVDEMTLQK